MFEARTEDRLEIQALIHRWCRGVDRRDWDLVRAVFHPDAHDDHGVFAGGVEDMIAWLRERHAEITQSMHHAGNILIEFAGPDRAVVETYVMARQRYAATAHAARVAMLGEAIGGQAGALEMSGAGRYVDVVERRDGAWQIARRTVVYEAVSATLVSDEPSIQPGCTTARRDRQDAIYLARAAAAIV